MYYLIVLLGSEENIIKEVANLPYVKEARATYGIHDIFCQSYICSKELMNNTITNKIRKTQELHQR
jgi:hypothetical protein